MYYLSAFDLTEDLQAPDSLLKVILLRKLNTGPTLGIGADIPGHSLNDIMKTELLKGDW